jgi:hypothetical protein
MARLASTVMLQRIRAIFLDPHQIAIGLTPAVVVQVQLLTRLVDDERRGRPFHRTPQESWFMTLLQKMR